MKRTHKITASPSSDLQFLDDLKNTFSTVTGIININELTGLEHDVDYLRRTGPIGETNSSRVVVFSVNVEMNQFKEKFGEPDNGKLPFLERLGVYLLRLQVETRIKRFYVLFNFSDKLSVSNDFFWGFFKDCPLALFVSEFVINKWTMDYDIPDVCNSDHPVALLEHSLRIQFDKGVNTLIPYIDTFESTKKFHLEAQYPCVYEVFNDENAWKSWVDQFYITGDDMRSPERIKMIMDNIKCNDIHKHAFGNICLSMADLHEKKVVLALADLLSVYMLKTQTPISCTLRIVDFGLTSEDNRVLAEFIRFCPLTSFVCMWSFINIWKMSCGDYDEGIDVYRKSKLSMRIDGFDYASEIPHYRQYFKNKALQIVDGKLHLPEQVYIRQEDITVQYLEVLENVLKKIAASAMSKDVVFINLKMNMNELESREKTGVIVDFFDKFQEKHHLDIVVSLNVSDFGKNVKLDSVLMHNYLLTSQLTRFMGYHSFMSLWRLTGFQDDGERDHVYNEKWIMTK